MYHFLRTKFILLGMVLILLMYLLVAKSPREIVLAKVAGVSNYTYQESVTQFGEKLYTVKAVDVDHDVYTLRHKQGEPLARLISKHICGDGSIMYNYYEDYFMGIGFRRCIIGDVKSYADKAIYEAQLNKY